MEHTDQEEQFVASQRGKWSQRGIPHRGWICVGIEDLREPRMQCEMCESQTIRYVHHMRHPEYAGTLAIGCICAGHMEGNLAAARGRETAMQSRAVKRKRWITRKWKVSTNGNPCIRADGFRVTVYRRGVGWGAVVSAEDNSIEPKHSHRNYTSVDDARLAAFDEITRLLSNKKV